MYVDTFYEEQITQKYKSIRLNFETELVLQ